MFRTNPRMNEKCNRRRMAVERGTDRREIVPKKANWPKGAAGHADRRKSEGRLGGKSGFREMKKLGGRKGPR